MTLKLFFQAILKFLFGVLLTGAILFLSAGTLRYPNAWLFIVALFVPMFVAGIVMLIKNPKLLASRLNANETRKTQSTVVKLSALMFLIGFVLAGLDFRFQWLPIPTAVSYVATGVLLLSYLAWAEVLRENTYLSRTVKVEEGQKVIDKGLYAIVRHPMYSASVFLFLSMPLVLGSLISFFVFLFYPVLIAVRILNEEKLLETELNGYIQYKQKVKYRLFPCIW